MAFYFTQAEMKEDLVRSGGSWGAMKKTLKLNRFFPKI